MVFRDFNGNLFVETGAAVYAKLRGPERSCRFVAADLRGGSGHGGCRYWSKRGGATMLLIIKIGPWRLSHLSGKRAPVSNQVQADSLSDVRQVGKACLLQIGKACLPSRDGKSLLIDLVSEDVSTN